MNRVIPCKLFYPTILVFVVQILALMGGCQSQSNSSSDGSAASPAGGRTAGPGTPAEKLLMREATAELVKSGWDKEAAEAVISLNMSWFSMLLKDDKAELERQLQILSRLGNYPQFMQVLKIKPETAGLLASASDPKLIEASLQAHPDPDYVSIANLYVLHAAPEDAHLLAEALQRHKALLVRLNNIGFLGSETLFIFPRKSEGAREYDLWISELLNSKLGNYEGLSQTITFLLSQGRLIRDRLDADSEFRRQVSVRILAQTKSYH